MKSTQLFGVLTALCFSAPHGWGNVLINEILFRPPSGNAKEDFIEFYNDGSQQVSLQGWQLTAGVQFTFPNVSIPARGYLVVAADVPTFQNKYPGVANVVGGWSGRLSFGGEGIDLDDASGKQESSVHYATEGDWAVRARGPLDQNHQGWIWQSAADGGGSSLELMNPAMPNDEGQNWASSQAGGGTPGRANSVASANIPPLILNASHYPIVPRSSETVEVSARLEDEGISGVSAQVRFRVDGASGFQTLAMVDDGTGGDRISGDGYYTATLPAQPANTIVEFFVEAVDGQGNRRTWPGPTAPDGTQSANCLYQVRDSVYAGPSPLYLLIMTEAERDELDYLGDTLPDALSDAQMNGTFISMTPERTELRYQVGIRNRGHGTRTERPNNYRLNFPNDHLWHEVDALNLNTRAAYSQVLGPVIFRNSGVPVQNARFVRVRVNNTDLANSGPSQFGFYAANEVLDDHYAKNHFPSDPKGNLYRGIASDNSEAGLQYLGNQADPYRVNYFKETNTRDDDWSDLIAMTRAISDENSSDYGGGVSQVIHINEWLRYFAINALLDNNETGIYMGYGDDYALYAGEQDRRFFIVSYDMDTLMGEGSEGGSATADIFRATALAALNRFLNGPEFRPLYFAHLRGLIETTFSPEQMNTLLDYLLGGVVSASTLDRMKTFTANRDNYVLSLLPDLVPIDQAWTYDDSGNDRGPAWSDPSFDDSSWPSGPGLFYHEPASLPEKKRTHLRLGPSTYYFRTHFYLDPATVAHLGTARLETRTIVDDGAVVYLNGQELFRLGMPGGSVSYDTAASRSVGDAAYEGPFFSPAGVLRAGDNVLAVEVHQSDPGSSDAVFGMTLNLSIAPRTVKLNEVLANNASLSQSDGSNPDWVELYNFSGRTVDLSGMGLTDDPAQPHRWSFPGGASIPAYGYYLVFCDPGAAASDNNTGFGLDRSGETVLLFEPADAGGALIDSVQFGLQAPDLPIGRVPDGLGDWTLAQPTPGGANATAATADRLALKINEWMARPATGDDWFELFNPQSGPVNLSGLTLSDNPGNRSEDRLPPLSFMGGGANGFEKFQADGHPGKGANHTGFQLSGNGESIALFDGAGASIDMVQFGPQQTGVSEGRYPDGADERSFFSGSASPGESNYRPAADVDSDGDGMPDQWETAHGLDPHDATDASRDADGDGLSNLQEYKGGTDPADPSSSLVIGIVPEPNRTVMIRFRAVAGKSYMLESTDALENGWTKLKDIPAPPADSMVEVGDSLPGGVFTRFYRIVIPDAP